MPLLAECFWVFMLVVYCWDTRISGAVVLACMLLLVVADYLRL
jgi:hypothetical protein